MDSVGSLTTLYHFVAQPLDGAEPSAGGLIQGSDGNFYGTTYQGGENNLGTVFKMDSSGAAPIVTTLHSFAGQSDGSLPFAGVIQGDDGNFYGTTYLGGTNNLGSIFKID